MMPRPRPTALAALFLPALAAAPAAAQDAAGAWSGRLTLYGWMSALDVNATARLPGGGTLSGSGSAGIGDVFDALNMAFFANGEVRRGRWGLVADIVYADLNFHGPNRVGGRNDLDMNSFLGSAAVAWRAYADDRAWIDVMGGARLVSLETTVSRSGPFASQRATTSDTWVDPVIGLRGRYEVAPRTALFGLADIGGFGVGSQFSWEVIAGASYDVTDRISGELAFRYLSIDYESGPVEQELEMYGPMLGLSVKF